MEKADDRAEILLRIVRNAKCPCMIKILMDRVEEEKEAYGTAKLIESNFMTIFEKANLPQKRLMLAMTKSTTFKSLWLEKLSAADVLTVARPKKTSENTKAHTAANTSVKKEKIDFSLLAFCPNQKLETIIELLDDEEKKQFTVWKQMNSIGMPRDSLKDFIK